MQENYVSLNPDMDASRQSFYQRQSVWTKRYQEAKGGPLASSAGCIGALTAGSYFYVRAQRHGFPGFFPLTRVNAGHYTMILGASFLAHAFFSGLVSSITGDAQ
jgi:hypothetical protein